jgi:hypothetical protein
MASSPDNYALGRGILSFKETGQTNFRDMGNCTSLEFSSEIETLEHFSSRTGVRVKDAEVVLQTSGSLVATVDEITMENLRLAFLGSALADQVSADPGYDPNATDQRKKFNGLAAAKIEGSLRWVGTNAVGRRFQVDFHKVSLAETGSFNFIAQDDWAEAELTFDVLFDTTENAYFTVYEIESPVSPNA